MEIKVFVYGTLRTGDIRAGGDSFKEMIALEAYIEGFDMLDLGGFPGLVPGNNRIRGEVHEYSHFRTLDMIEGYHEKDPKSSFYIRRLVDVEVPEGVLKGCWVYCLNRIPQRPKLPIIESGDWFEHRGYYDGV